MVERANYEVTRFLTACVADVDVRANWPTYIPFVQRIMNTMIKTSTGVQIHNETTEFPIGSYVLAEYETGKSSKFHTKRHGPYRVINKLGSIYSLENLVTNKITDFHVLFGAVEKVQKYLNNNQMRKHIPIKYTWDKNHPNYEPPIKRSRSS